MIFFLHHYFQIYGVGEKTVILQADNCGGQNKNRYIMNYLAFRVLNKMHTEITIIFNESGDLVNVIQYKWYDEVGFSNLPGIRKLHYFKFESKKQILFWLKTNQQTAMLQLS